MPTLGVIADSHVQTYYLDPSIGFVYTLDAPDLTIDGDVRWIAKFRQVGAEITQTQGWIAKTNGSPGGMSYSFGNTYSASVYAALGWPTGTSSPQVGTPIATRTQAGLTPPGSLVHLGGEFRGNVPGSQVVRATVQGIRSLDNGATWEIYTSVSSPLRADWLSFESPTRVEVGQITGIRYPGHLYWFQLDAVRRARLVFPGVAGNYLSTPDAAALDIAGDIEIVVRMALDDWESAAFQGIVMKCNDNTGVSTQRSFMFRHNQSRTFQFLHTTDGITLVPRGSSAHPSWTPGQLVWVRVRQDVDNGAGSRVTSFDYSTEDSAVEPTTWTNFGSSTEAPAISRFVGTAPLSIGTDHSSRWFDGRIARVIIRDGIAGTTVFDVSENNAYNAGSTFVATSGQTVTVNQTAGNTIAQNQPDQTIFRFDPNEYGGSGATWTDARGRLWQQSVVGCIVSA